MVTAKERNLLVRQELWNMCTFIWLYTNSYVHVPFTLSTRELLQSVQIHVTLYAKLKLEFTIHHRHFSLT